MGVHIHTFMSTCAKEFFSKIKIDPPPPALIILLGAFGVQSGHYIKQHIMSFQDATCMEEMSKLMNCFKREKFEDQKCSKEIGEFLECAKIAVNINVALSIRPARTNLFVRIHSDWIALNHNCDKEKNLNFKMKCILDLGKKQDG